ncbi:MAG: ketosteroid isomerase-related protein [Hyphomicrobiaceae bacterium]
MTAPDSEALIRKYYDAFNRGDVRGMLDCIAEDVVHDVNQGERRIGKERFHAFCERAAHHYREQLEDIAVMTSRDGSRAAAEFNVVGTYLVTETGLPEASGQRYALPAGAFFAVRGGLISRVTTYYNLTDWIMQVSAPGPEGR